MADSPTTEGLSNEQKLGLALVSLLTPAAGYMMGGKEGAMAGAQVGFNAAGGAAGDIGKQQREDAKTKKAAEAAESKYQRERTDRKTDAIEIDKAKKGNSPPDSGLQQSQFLDKDGNPLAWDKKAGKYIKTGAPEGIQRYEKAPAPKAEGEMLPIDQKKIVEGLATKNASKEAIKNQMVSYYDQFKNAKSKDDQIRIGRQMLKVLNSPEGADAIGVEEANRLGNALEVQVFNWKGPGPLFGRDLEGFGSQVEATIGAMDGSIQANQAQIDKLMGRAPSGQTSSAAPKAGDVVDGYVFLGGDPSDQKNWKVKE